ncbi:hypothetical protein L7F22_050900 [Adiantum nelumboides]|nr:hypothetical protein [Adiantum nelumboides]
MAGGLNDFDASAFSPNIPIASAFIHGGEQSFPLLTSAEKLEVARVLRNGLLLFSQQNPPPQDVGEHESSPEGPANPTNFGHPANHQPGGSGGVAAGGSPSHGNVRQICKGANLDFWWAKSAMGCLHQATEDFLIEFFQDNCVLSSHAHRVTVMPWDINSLTLLRFKYNKTLAPVHLSDKTMDNILSIPPITKVEVSDVTTTQHIYGTRLNVERPQELPVEEPSNEWEISLALDQANNETLVFLGPSFDVTLFVWEQILYFGLAP